MQRNILLLLLRSTLGLLPLGLGLLLLLRELLLEELYLALVYTAENAHATLGHALHFLLGHLGVECLLHGERRLLGRALLFWHGALLAAHFDGRAMRRL